MDDLTWQSKIDKRRKSRKREKIFLIVAIILAIIAGILGYMYTMTPDYALSKAYSSVRDQDVGTFAKYVDAEKLAGQAYDDLTRDLFAYDDALSDSEKLILEKFYQSIRPQVAGGTAKLVLAMVANGEWIPPSGDNILKGRQLGIDYEYLVQRSQLRNTSILSVGTANEVDGAMEASVDVVDDYTDTKYTLRIVLEKNGDGVWQVVRIANYRGFLDLLEPIQKSDMTSYLALSKGAMDECNAALAKCKERFEALSKTADGNFTDEQRQALIAFVKSDIIAALEKHIYNLRMLEVPKSTRYLHDLRIKSAQLSIDSWQMYIQGMANKSPDDISKSKSMYKEAADLDYRIDDMIKRTSVVKAGRAPN